MVDGLRSEAGQIALLLVVEEPKPEPEPVPTLRRTVERVVTEKVLRPETVIQPTVQVKCR